MAAARLALAGLFLATAAAVQSAAFGQSVDEDVISRVAMVCPDRVHIYVTNVWGALAMTRPDLAECNISEWRLVRRDPADPAKVTTLIGPASDPAAKISYWDTEVQEGSKYEYLVLMHFDGPTLKCEEYLPGEKLFAGTLGITLIGPACFGYVYFARGGRTRRAMHCSPTRELRARALQAWRRHAVERH